MDQVATLSHQHEGNGLEEAYIKFVKCLSQNADRLIMIFILLSFDKISTSSTGLHSSATWLLNRPIRAPLSQTGREPVNIKNDDEY